MSNERKLALLVMAAGMGSRYGGIKQIDGFGPNGETIMDYSLHDALKAGFTKFVFVVREEIRQTIQDIFLPKLQGKAEVHFVIQSLNKFVPEKFGNPDRTKPWGTTHAMLCGKEAIQEPFAVINADDFYGYQAFESLATFLRQAHEGHHCMVGYKLKDVLSNHGTVSRGYAEQSPEGLLIKLTELTTIEKQNDQIVSKSANGNQILDPNAPVSMNCWGFLPSVFSLCEDFFTEFLEKQFNDPKSEYYIALMVTAMINRNLGNVHIIPGGDTWFGVTYQEDKQTVKDSIRALVNSGRYPQKLWN